MGNHGVADTGRELRIHLAQFSPSRDTRGRVCIGTARQLLDISVEEAHSLQTAVSVICHCTAQQCFLVFTWNLHVLVCVYHLLSWHCKPLKEAWLCPLCILPSGGTGDSPVPSILQGELVQLSQPSLQKRCSNFFIIFMVFHWTLSVSFLYWRV